MFKESSFPNDYFKNIILYIFLMDPSVDTIKCTYGKGGKPEDNPHIHEPFRPLPKKIFDDVLDAIGNTPMIKINRIGPLEGVSCELLAKC